MEQQLVDMPEALEAVQGCFDHFTKPFTGLESHYKQKKFFQEKFGLQVSTVTYDKRCTVLGLMCFCANESDRAFIPNTRNQ